MMTVDELKRILGVTEDQELAEKLNKRSASVVSNWRKAGRVPTNIELVCRDIIKNTVINGNGHQIDVYNASHGIDKQQAYSPALVALKGLAETLPESKKWKLVKLAIELRDDEEEQ